MTTVGYGDIKPTNQLEVTIAITITIITTGVFAYCINQIGTIVKFLSEEKEKSKYTIQIINNYMSKKNINKDLQQQIREYLEYYLKESTINDHDKECKIINMLSEPLQKQLMIQANKIALIDSPIFRNNFTENTIQKTVFLIQEIRCTPEEILFYEGDLDDCSIFFILQGKLELFVDSDNNLGKQKINSLKIFNKGQCVGEQSFFTGQPRETSIRSVDFTTLLMIKRQDFISILKESPIDYENYCHIKDKLVLYKNYKNLGNKCLSCDSDYHFVNECPYIHYIPNQNKNQEWFDEYQKSDLEYNVYLDYDENNETNSENLINVQS
ncbi:hypothetical protein IMG5_198840 [Ichthyophthirius multifiliis]|uniref:Cyclic nucleotide-binding domain-containing protein n=1 Tax=Ichthyophthirius multifiliis TaxID=5932 RepID=G0R5H0_ICHMU|nr:hypothetical protein IMG5_198840 [Ichthyophthirius multifiliis]EGR27292.1 hypothetical protein IMG5_198840 [Ichthyophthirius multifiliis]|eukprot:XP_004024176.1 hypothetical protein IMG5_198840 [Ichthyophthirius multifiliis]